MKRLLLAVGIFFYIGCGTNNPEVRVVEVPPDEDDDDDDDDPLPSKLNYTQMKTLLDEYCAACHASAKFMQNEAQLRQSDAENQLWTKRMPPANAAKALPDRERNLMINFFR